MSWAKCFLNTTEVILGKVVVKSDYINNNEFYFDVIINKGANYKDQL